MTTVISPAQQVEKLDETEALTGNTPLIPIKTNQQDVQPQLFAKLENRQLGRSTAARVAFSIVRTAILEGKLVGDRMLLDTAGTQMALAYGAVCARLSIPVTLVMAESTSADTLVMLKAFGVKVVLEQEENISARLANIQAQEPEAYFFADHENQDDVWKVHYLGTAKEIYHQTQGQLTHFVADAAQRSLLLGTGKKLKEVNKDIQLVALQQQGSMDAQAENHHPYADKTILVDADMVDSRIDTFAKEAGMIISKQSAINLIGLEALAATLEDGVLVTVFPEDSSIAN